MKKKVISAMLAVAMVVGITACSSETTTSEPTTTEETENKEEETSKEEASHSGTIVVYSPQRVLHCPNLH